MLYLQNVYVENNDIKNALKKLAYISDDDFIGINGEEFLWDVAKKNGFNTNLDYILSLIDFTKSPDSIVSDFLDNWMGNDDFFHEYDFTISYNEDNIITITVAYTDNGGYY